jgi:peroxiredoxin Q/BCP
VAITLKVGDRAPAFTLKCTDGRHISLADFAGQKQVVLFFYSRDSSVPDAAEARGIRDAMPRFQQVNSEVIGVSVDDVYSHRKFERENKLNFLLLSDITKTVSNAYGVLRKEGHGVRASFVVDKQGLLKAIFPVVKPETHIDELIKSLKGVSNLSAGPPKGGDRDR